MSPKRYMGFLSDDFCNKFNIQEFKDKKVVMYSNRYSHIERHKEHFETIENYENAVNSIEDIIKNPLEVIHDPSKMGLEFYAIVDELVLVAIRADLTASELKIKSMYPVTEAKLKKRQEKFK